MRAHPPDDAHSVRARSPCCPLPPPQRRAGADDGRWQTWDEPIPVVGGRAEEVKVKWGRNLVYIASHWPGRPLARTGMRFAPSATAGAVRMLVTHFRHVASAYPSPPIAPSTKPRFASPPIHPLPSSTSICPRLTAVFNRHSRRRRIRTDRTERRMGSPRRVHGGGVDLFCYRWGFGWV